MAFVRSRTRTQPEPEGGPSSDAIGPSASHSLSPSPASSLASSYAARLASWSQPKGPSTQPGFRIGRGAFLRTNQSKLILEALSESDQFIAQLISAAATCPAAPTPLTRPLVIPQSFTGSPTAHFLRSTTDELNHDPNGNGIPVEVFTDFIDLLNSLLLAGIGGGCAAADLQSDHDHQILQPTLPNDYASPPPDYQNQPKPVDRFLLLCNQYLFRPRQIECRILTHEQLRSHLSLPDPLKQMSPDQILRHAQQPSSPRSISCIPSELVPLTLPLKLTRLSHFPTRARSLAQIYRPRPTTVRRLTTPPVSGLINHNNGQQTHSITSEEGWNLWRTEMENLAKSNLLMGEPAYWILIDKI